MTTENPEPQQTEQPPKQMKFFRKELVSMPFFAAGKRVQFEALSQNSGAIVLDAGDPNDQPIIEALETAAKARRGGIVILKDEQAYLDLKKKRIPLMKSGLERKQQKLRVLPTVRPKKQPSPNAKPESAAAVVKPESSPEVGGTGSGDNGGVAKPAGTAMPPFVPKLQRRSVVAKHEPVAKAEDE